ncbi:ABC transporter substrate-binding protein [Nocardia higoensis]|uniref:ABC transporter substrate-binding protein n=1 Tax=Nocardia higoensis TaxID=228599 RepID=UPI0003031BC5|nr:ABC transporter substrate-binding protein [Nocardia higoensis]
MSRRFRGLLSTAAVALAAATLVACGSGPSTPGEPAGDPVYGGTLTFYDPVQYTAWLPTASLWSNSQVANNLADRLTWQDPKTGEIVPWLATSWEISDDKLSYTFHLREGVTFSNGDPLDAEVVKANYDQHGFGDAALGIPKDSFFADYAGTEVVDPLTVRVRFTKPNAGFLQVVSFYRTGSILARPYLALDLNAQGQAQNWIASGPFVVESVQGTTGITLQRREDYDWAPATAAHQGKAYLERIVFTTVPEAGSRVGALQSGQAHIARNIAPYDEETVVAGGGRIEAFPVQGQTNKLTFQLDSTAPVHDKNVRLALQAATNREEINATVLSPSYPIPTSILVQGTPSRGDASSYLTYDPDKANRLLDEAGWAKGGDGYRAKDGKRLSFQIWIAPYYQVSQPVLELLQSQWKKVGVELVINAASQTEYESIRAARGDDWALAQGQTSRAEPDVLRAAFDSTATDEIKNPTPDAKLDELVRAQAYTFDPAERAAAVQAIEDHLFANAYVIPLYDETQVFGLAPTVHGFSTESTARAWLHDTWITE